MITKDVTWIEGRAEAKDIIFALADAITQATMPNGEDNRWKEVFRQEEIAWVTYQQRERNTLAKYKHTDGNEYQVYRTVGSVTCSGSGCDRGATPPSRTPEGYWKEEKSHYVFTVDSQTYINPEGEEVTVPFKELLLVNVLDPESPVGYSCYIVEQGKYDLEGNWVPDSNWHGFRIVAPMPTNWNYLLTRSSQVVTLKSGEVYVNGIYFSYSYTFKGAEPYSFREIYYTANPLHHEGNIVVLECTPDGPEGKQESFKVMLNQPMGQYNYFDVIYGKDFEGVNAVGDPTVTYEGACDPRYFEPGKAPTIIDMVKAEHIYRLQESGAIGFTPPSYEWSLDIDGIRELVSPKAHFFFGCDSVVPWLPNKKRRADYWVRYWISLNNDRVALVLEGDPAPDIDGYYRSFGYIGAIVPFNKDDYEGNFAVTVGMGDLVKEKTGFESKDIKQDENPSYAGWGRYTSNGMYSISMFRTASKVFFQAHYPAFLTQLPGYTGVGTLPAKLKSLVLNEDGYQPSLWTDKYHASPVYVVHLAEGYRGYLQGVVAINDHNLVNLDELVVDTEVPIDPENPESDTIKEVYKFLSINTPISLFKHSANPDEMTIAILKEIRR